MSSQSTAIHSRAIAQTGAIEVDPRYEVMKRALDIALTAVALIPASIIMGLVALAIRLDSPGPILFRQTRVGKDGARFEMLKFRSMYHNCPQTSHADSYARYIQGAVLNTTDPKMPYKVGKDPRITRVGWFIRKSSLDELPQLYNVLLGHMSIVGPRPPIPYEVEHYSARDLLRLSGKPGLTGIWQVYGRGRVPFREMVEQDITYLQSQSILYDLKLICLTVPVVIYGRGGA